MTAILKRVLSDPDCNLFRKKLDCDVFDLQKIFVINDNKDLVLNPSLSIKSVETFNSILEFMELLEKKISKKSLEEYYKTGRLHNVRLMGEIDENYSLLSLYVLGTQKNVENIPYNANDKIFDLDVMSEMSFQGLYREAFNTLDIPLKPSISLESLAGEEID